MATIKSYTDLEQSKKLAKILPIESADMIYLYWIDRNKQKGIDIIPTIREGLPIDSCDIPCWSLSALLDALPNNLQIGLAINDFQGDRKEKYALGSVEHDKYDCYADNPIDACVDLIEKLHELKML